MSKLKFGFHTSSSGHGVDQLFYQALDQAGIPFFAKGTDSLPYDAQTIAAASTVPHTVVYRTTLDNINDPYGRDPNVPDYSKSPTAAATEHWAWHKRQAVRARVDPNTTWLETINEVDKNHAEWLAEFAIATAQLTMADGYKWLAFGWSTGEPEVAHWEGPKMQEFLSLVAANPDKLGIALHEYSLDVTNIENAIGYLIGRFQLLLDINPNVNIYITEWGWEYASVPTVAQAMQDYMTIGALYAQYPQIKGAATWALNGGWGNIGATVVQYIFPLLELTLNTDFGDPEEPTMSYYKELHLLPQDATLEEWLEVATSVYPNKNTLAFSADDVKGVLLLPDTRADSKVVVHGPNRWVDDIVAWFTNVGINVETRPLGTTPPTNPLIGLQLGPPFRVPYMMTSPFNAPRNYGNGLHEGVDYDILTAAPDSDEHVLALYPGVVTRVERKTTGYGNNVIIAHERNGSPFYTLMAHMDAIFVTVGDIVAMGDAIGEIGSTGNSSGEHIHINLEAPNYGLRGYVRDWVVDPAPYIPTTPIGISPAVNFGIHGPADPAITPAAQDMLNRMQPETIKILSSVDKNNLGVTKAAHPTANWIIRAFLDFGGRNVTPQQFVDWTLNDVTECLVRVGISNSVVELHNEPNLYSEGLGGTWANAAAFNAWYLNVLQRYRQALPGVRFIFPGLSPGESIPGVRIGHREFAPPCTEAINASDGLGIHTYWNSVNYPMSNALAVLDWYSQQFPNKLIYITEASNNMSTNATPEQKANEYVQFWQTLKQRPKIASVAYFVLTATNPAWHWGTGSGEVWTTEMARIVSRR